MFVSTLSMPNQLNQWQSDLCRCALLFSACSLQFCISTIMQNPTDFFNFIDQSQLPLLKQSESSKHLWTDQETQDLVDHIYDNCHEAGGQGFKATFWNSLLSHLTQQHPPQRTKDALQSKYNNVRQVLFIMK